MQHRVCSMICRYLVGKVCKCKQLVCIHSFNNSIFLDLLRTVRPICLHMEKRLHLICSGCASDILQYQVRELFTTRFHQLSRKFHQFRKFHDFFCFSGFRMFAAMVASTTHRRHLMVQKIFTPRFIFEAAGFGVSLATMCLSYLTFVRIRGSISKYVKAL